MKSEVRLPKSERNPKAEARRSSSPHCRKGTQRTQKELLLLGFCTLGLPFEFYAFFRGKNLSKQL